MNSVTKRLHFNRLTGRNEKKARLKWVEWAIQHFVQFVFRVKTGRQESTVVLTSNLIEKQTEASAILSIIPMNTSNL